MRRDSICYAGSAIAVLGIALIAFSVRFPSAAADRQTAQLGEQRPSLEAPLPGPKDGTPATVIDDQDIEGILGKNVRSVAGEDMGRIVDVLVSRAGQMRAAVIDFGGFLGVGSRKIAVDWSALRFPEAGKWDRITLELTRDQVRLAPEYRPGTPVVVLGVSGPSQAAPSSVSPRSER